MKLEKTKTISHYNNISNSFPKKIGKLAQQNQVRNFNKPRASQSIPPSLPQRIQLPLFFNTPFRNKVLKTNLSHTLPDPLDEKIEAGIYISTMRRLKDYQMLAFGCKRGGKIRDQGRAYYSIGVLYDNIKRYKKGIQYYQKFLQICKNIGDSHGQALAYNCIGVNYQILGQKDKVFINKAIEIHNKHEQLADTNGKFLASINLGLCYDILNDNKNSLYWYQNALKHSVKLSNLVGQSIAIGNIGKIGAKGLNDNKDKMKLFVEKYLALAKQMKDQKNQMNGYLKMGMIQGNKRQFQEGRQNFLKALQLAENNKQTNIYNEAKCGLAVVNAQKNMNTYLQKFTNKFQSSSQQPQ